MRLAVRGSRSLALEAWCLQLAASFLVFCNNLDDAIQMPLVLAITHGRHRPVPACATVAALVALFRCRAAGVVR